MPPTATGRNERNPIKIVIGASWLYPIKGIFYFLSRSYYWPLFKSRLIAVILLSIFVYSLLFTFAFLPQVAFLFLFHGAGAWVNGVFLTLGEGSAVIALLFEAWFVDEQLVDCFDATLCAKGHSQLLSRGRMLDTTASNPVKMLGQPAISSVYSPFSLRQIIEFVILLPLNFVPIVGVPLFVLGTGYRAGPLQHYRYFKLLDMPKKDKRKFVKQRQLKYTWFGCVHILLQLVPGLSMLFLMTTAVGSALWVVKLEEQRTMRIGETIRPDDSYADEPAQEQA